MARADYDYNIWSNEPDTLTLTAYRQYVHTADDDYIQTDTENYIHVTFRFPEDIEEIEYLLKDLYINQYPLTDYDEWVDNPFTLGEDAPPKVAQFLESLPDYEMERV